MNAWLVLAFVALVTSARTRYMGVPVLWLIAAAVVLALAVLVLWLLRTAFRDGGWLRLRPVAVNL